MILRNHRQRGLNAFLKLRLCLAKKSLLIIIMYFFIKKIKIVAQTLLYSCRDATVQLLALLGQVVTPLQKDLRFVHVFIFVCTLFELQKTRRFNVFLATLVYNVMASLKCAVNV